MYWYFFLKEKIFIIQIGFGYTERGCGPTWLRQQAPDFSWSFDKR
jgi:hypothetical protein